VHVLSGDSAIVWLVKVVGASMAVGVIPGALMVLAWRPRRAYGLIELAAISLAGSFALVQVLTVAALIFHWSVATTLALLAGAALGHGVVALRRHDRGISIWISPGEMVLVGALSLIWFLLYAVGSPVRGNEDVIHIGIVQRLIHLPDPAIDNIYVVPGIVYTYPFPGIHYLLALIARVGDIDAVFLYDKMRGFWGVSAAILLYGCARSVFESTRIALAAVFVAIALVVNGTFALVPGMYWAQMAPLSHASDVAMGVLLPALLLAAFEYLQAIDHRERWFFLVLTLLMSSMLIVVHPREIVQFLVYLTAFLLTLVFGRGPQRLTTRTAMLLVITLGLLIVYTRWHQSFVPTIDTLVREHRADVLRLFRDLSWSDLIGPPLPLLRAYIPASEAMFYGWNPLLLIVSPAVLFVLRRKPLTWFPIAGIACYLLIIGFPVFALPYLLPSATSFSSSTCWLVCPCTC
jgi:hypothetical protein